MVGRPANDAYIGFEKPQVTTKNKKKPKPAAGSKSQPKVPEVLEKAGKSPASQALVARPEARTPAPIRPADPLDRYIEEIRRYPVLSPEEQTEIAKKFFVTKDRELAKQLVTANLRLVVKIALEYRHSYQNVLDLIQEGNVGLLKAVSNYDPYKGTRLSYYASWWIRSYILKFLLDNFRLVKIGTTQAQKKLFYNLVREQQRLEAQGLDAGPKLLADKLHVREQDVKEMKLRLSSEGGEVSIDHPLPHEDSEGAPPRDYLVSGAVPVDEELALAQLKSVLMDKVDSFVARLNEKERVLFRERLMAENPQTLQEIADKYGITRERARQIEARIIEKLREDLRNQMDGLPGAPAAKKPKKSK